MTQPGVQAIYSDDSAARVKADLETLTTNDAELASRCSFVTAKETLQRLSVPDAKAAIVTDVAARCWPYKLVAGVVEDLVLDEGLQGRFNLQTWTPVQEIKREGKKWNVGTERGGVKTKYVVLATNGYTSALVPDYKDLIVPCRGQMSALLPPEELRGEGRLKTSLGFMKEGNHDYLVQRSNEKGGHLMFGGAETYGPRLGVTDDSIVDERQTDWLRKSLPMYLSLEDKKKLELVQTWSGIMGFSRDEVPLVGPVPGKEGLFMCAGFTGHGMPNTWLCGKTTALMVGQIRNGASTKDAVDTAAEETKLPKAYQLSEARLANAREKTTVYEVDEKYFEAWGGREQ